MECITAHHLGLASCCSSRSSRDSGLLTPRGLLTPVDEACGAELGMHSASMAILVEISSFSWWWTDKQGRLGYFVVC